MSWINAKEIGFNKSSLLLNDVDAFINIVENTLSFKSIHGMDLFGIIIEKFSTEFVMELLSININQEPIMVNMLIDLTQAGVLTVLLVVMILKSNDTILIYEHGILHLS